MSSTTAATQPASSPAPDHPIVATTTPTTPEQDASAAAEKEARMAATKLDDFVQLGKYTLLVCLLSELMILAQLGNMLYMMYAGAAPALVSCGPRVFDAHETVNERCAFLEKANGTCTPIFKGQFHSVNIEFDYMCGAGKLVKQSISIQMLGVMVGSVIFGYLSDTYGRRRMMMVALALCLACMFATSFSGSLLSFTIWRFLVCTFNGGHMVILMVYVVESLPKKDRFWISNLITWSPNMVVFAVIAWLTQDWRLLTRVSALLALPAGALLFFLSESPRFLVQSRRLADAKAAIMRIHRFDGRPIDEAQLDYVLSKEEQAYLEAKQRPKYNYVHLFYTWTFARYSFAVAFSLMVTSIMNYSLLFNMEKVSGSLYLNSIFMGIFRYSCNLAIAFGDIRFNWLGRKAVHAIADILAASALGLYVVIYVMGLQVQLADLMRAAVLGVIGVCSLLYTTNGIASNELFPTCIRNLGYSFGQLFSRIGVVIAPQIYFLTDYWAALPFLVMFCLAMSDLIIFQFNVDETKGKPLTDGMPPKEQRIFYKGNKDIELLPKEDQQLNEQQKRAEGSQV